MNADARIDTPGRKPALALAIGAALVILLAPALYVVFLDAPVLRRSGLVMFSLIGVGVVAAIAAWRRDRRRRTRLTAGAAGALALLTAIGFFVGGRVPAAGAASDVAPDFTLPDQDGRSVSLANTRAGGPVMLLFYRGFW